MIYSFRMVGRTVFWHCKKSAGIMILLSLIVFFIVYGCAWQQGETSELFTIYLGGFRHSVQLALFWLAVHLPVEGLVYGWITNQSNKSYCIKLMKYESKLRYFLFMIISVIIQLVLYYIIGYGVLLILSHGNDIGLACGQMVLGILESFSIVLAATVVGLFRTKFENIAFPAAIIAELVCCILCSINKGLRVLPFTYGKLVLQEEYFDNGRACIASFVVIGILLILTAVLWLKKDERSGEY